jgi:hypothetical protein
MMMSDFMFHSVSPPLLSACTFYGMMVDSDTDKYGIIVRLGICNVQK